MEDTKQLGIYWGNDALYFVQSTGTAIEKTFQIPLHGTAKPPEKKGTLDAWGQGLASSIKTTLNQHRTSATIANLSLPIKDIIFRSFMIPFMQPHEIKSVVEFEITKYIPFSLKELSYSFHPIALTEEGRKTIRIIFVAIKNDALNYYASILSAGSLRIKNIEPAPSSLIRVLNFKELIPGDQTIAIVEKEDVGRIIVIDSNIPQFVREFHLMSPMQNQESEDPQEDVKRLSKEVRISLDYFNRQNEQLSVKKIFLLAASHQESLSEELEKYLNIEVSAIADKVILGNAPGRLGTVHAYGAGIISSSKIPISFILSAKETDLPKPKKKIERKPIQYKPLIKTALICASLILAILVGSKVWMQQLIGKKEIFNQQLGALRDSETSFIEKKQQQLQIKLDHFRKTRLHSD